MVRMRNILDDVPHPALAALIENVLSGGNWAPVMCWAVFTTRCIVLWSDVEQLLSHTEIQFVSILSMVHQ